VPVNEGEDGRSSLGRGRVERASRKNMVHEGTGLWHAAGFNASRWLMIIIHGYRATTLVLYILLNVMVRTGEYNRLPDTPFGDGGLFSRELFARASGVGAERSSGAGTASNVTRIDCSFLPFHPTWYSCIPRENLFRKYDVSLLFFDIELKLPANRRALSA